MGDDVADLYALPLTEFTAARDATARRLREAGDKEAAAAVTKLKKPTVDAWALNQLPRRFESDLAELVDVTRRVGEVREASEVRRLSARRHDLVAGLVRSASKLLADAGHSPGSETEHRIAQALYGATSHDDLAALQRGTFTRPGTGSSFASGELALEPERVRKRRSDPARKKRAEMKQRLAEARKEAGRLGRAADHARRAAEVAEEEAAVAQREVMRLERRVERLD